MDGCSDHREHTEVRSVHRSGASLLVIAAGITQILLVMYAEASGFWLLTALLFISWGLIHIGD